MLMERILKRENLLAAIKRVERNNGSAGVDGMDAKSLRVHIVEHWKDLRSALLSGTYEPQPVLRVEIPKPDGGVRLLGIPTVTDRFIQQAIAQSLTGIYDPTFSEHSYGFRQGRSAHEAVRKAQNYIREGYRWVVDIDLEKFFDRVNHDRLMSTIAKRVQDKRLLKLIRSFLNSGVLEDGLVRPVTEGAPQGGPLSPLLSNIVLDELDKELERRGHRFVRYADDCNIYVKSRRAGERVMESVTKFIEGTLKLKVNRQKSAVDRPWKRKFLGFSFTPNRNPKIRIANKSKARFKDRIREITSRKIPYSLEYRVQKLNKFLNGWVNYYQLADTPSVFKDFESWIRRRLRMCIWKDWKKPRTRIRNLIRLGTPPWQAYEWGNTRKGYWRISKSPIMHRTLGNSFWSSQGLVSLMARYELLRHRS